MAGCQSTSVPPYEVLAQDVVDGKTVEASRLRKAFIERADASAELTKIIELERQALALMVDQPLRLGAIGNAILESNYASLTGHLALQRFYTHLESAESAAVHEEWLLKLQALIEENAGSIAEPYSVYSAADECLLPESCRPGSKAASQPTRAPTRPAGQHKKSGSPKNLYDS